MFLLGLLSVLQVAFLPGYLALRWLRLRGGPIRMLVWSFGLSLVINHLVVVALLLAGIYQSTSLYLLFAAELLLLVGCTLPAARSVTMADAVAGVARGLAALRPWLPKDRNDRPGILRCLLLGGAVAVAVGYAVSGLTELGQIFSSWDAVASWNRWAIDWAEGRLPAGTYDYPQLLPTNWSMTYVFIQDTSVWFFAKAIMPCFCLLVLLATIDLYGETEDAGHLCATMLTYWLLVAILRFRNLGNGYADVPVAFFAFASVYTLLLARQIGPGGPRGRHVLLAAVLAAGAAVTKQAGLFIAAVYPLLVWLIVYRSPQVVARTQNARRSILAVLPATLLCAAIAAPWYVYRAIEIQAAQATPIASRLLFDVHEGRDVSQRLAYAGRQMLHALTIPGACVLLVLLAVSLRDPIGRWLTALVVVPFTLIWAVGFSYDSRNVALAIPLAAVAAGLGVRQLAELAGRLAARLGKNPRDFGPNMANMPLACLLIACALGVGVLNQRITRADLLARQQQLQRSVGLPEVNQQVYAYAGRSGIDGKIATDYWLLGWLPDLNQHYCPCSMGDLGTFRAQWRQPEVRYALIAETSACAEVLSYVDSACREGSMQVEVAFADYRLVRKSPVR